MNQQSAQKTNSRAAAARIIAEWLRTGRFPDRLIDADMPDRACVVEMVRGVAKWKRMLEWAGKRCADRDPDRQAWPFLLVGLYQIMVMDHIAHHAAVHESVEAVKNSRAAPAAGFINGILRSVLRELPAIRRELAAQPLGIKESHPDILIERWTRRWGEERTRRLCRWNNDRPSVILRPNRMKTDASEYLQLLARSGLKGAPHPFAPDDCIVLQHGVRVADLPGYADGLFSVQDPSTLEAVKLLDPRPGQRVLDACAAPGGKAIAIAERMKGRGHIVAMDLHADRLELVRGNAERMQLDTLETVQGDASSADEIRRQFAEGSLDRILLDVPCTNTGVLQRRPDARWRFSPERMAGLLQTQRAMLEATASRLKPDGILAYSTCSLEPEEGEDMVNSWLREHPGFALARAISLFPPDTLTDGIFAAAIKRVA